MISGAGLMVGLDAAQMEIYQLATHGAVAFDLARHGLICCKGKESGQFLHNLCTNEVAKLPVGRSSEAFLTTAQAKVVDYVWILRVNGSEPTFLLDAGENDGPRILKHLDRFLISEQLELVDLTEQMAHFHVAGPRSGQLLGTAIGCDLTPLQELDAMEVARGAARLHIWRRNRLGVLGYDLCWDRAESTAWTPVLKDLPVYSTDCAAFDCLRIEAGVPRFGVDVTEANLPQEVGRIEQSISFTKGCYIGQETVARVRSFGHVNRTLRGLVLTEKKVLEPGAKLFRDGQEVGAITSCAISPRLDRAIALAYLRRGHDEPGTNLGLRADDPGVGAIVGNLPFVPLVTALA